MNNLPNEASSDFGYEVQLNLHCYTKDSMEASTFNEKCYGIVLSVANSGDEICSYAVGKQTGNVYILPHESTYNYYHIKNNQVVRTFYK